MFIDTHLHFSSEYYDNLNEIYENAVNLDIKTLITSGCDKIGIEEIPRIIEKYDNVYASVGFHPSEKEIVDTDIDYLEKLIINHNKIVAIGEIGLDYYYDNDTKSKEYQQELFIKQLNLAKKLNKPIVVHMRNATDDTIKILSRYNLKGIIHCFNGSIETAKTFIRLGYKLGIGGVITFKNSHLLEIVELLDLKNIVLETDSPYLSPEPFRGKKNVPSNILYIAEKIAKMKNISIQEVGKITTNNVFQLFDLDR